MSAMSSEAGESPANRLAVLRDIVDGIPSRFSSRASLARSPHESCVLRVVLVDAVAVVEE